MKLEIHINPENEEKVLIFAKSRNETVIEIEKIVLNNGVDIVGYHDDEIIKINLNSVTCFITGDNKTYAIVGDKKYIIKTRLYKIEEMLNDSFIKINQSCIANIKKIKTFKAPLTGAMNVIFKNGYVDYISRRELKNVKERLGI